MIEKIALNADGSVSMGQYQAEKKEGRGRECVLIFISLLTIANRLFALLKIHGHATSVVRIRIQSVECIVNLCILSVVKYHRTIQIVFSSTTILRSSGSVKMTSE